MSFTRNVTTLPGPTRGDHRARCNPPLPMEFDRGHSPTRGRFTGNVRGSCSRCRRFSAEGRRTTFHAKPVSAQARSVEGALRSISAGADAYALDALSSSRRVTAINVCRTEWTFHGERTSPPDPSPERSRRRRAPASLPGSSRVPEADPREFHGEPCRQRAGPGETGAARWERHAGARRRFLFRVKPTRVEMASCCRWRKKSRRGGPPRWRTAPGWSVRRVKCRGGSSRGHRTSSERGSVRVFVVEPLLGGVEDGRALSGCPAARPGER